MISLSAVTDRCLTGRTVELAKEKGLTYTRSVEPTGTGTDANATQLTNCGVPTVVVGLPLQLYAYLSRVLSLDDTETLRVLIAAFVCDARIAEDFSR